VIAIQFSTPSVLHAIYTSADPATAGRVTGATCSGIRKQADREQRISGNHPDVQQAFMDIGADPGLLPRGISAMRLIKFNQGFHLRTGNNGVYRWDLHNSGGPTTRRSNPVRHPRPCSSTALRSALPWWAAASPKLTGACSPPLDGALIPVYVGISMQPARHRRTIPNLWRYVVSSIASRCGPKTVTCSHIKGPLLPEPSQPFNPFRRGAAGPLINLGRSRSGAVTPRIRSSISW